MASPQNPDTFILRLIKMSARFFLFGSLFLLLAGCQPPGAKTESFDTMGPEEPSQVEDANPTGPKLAFIVKDPRDPWEQREVAHANTEAKNDHAKVTVYKALNPRELESTFAEAHAKGVQGVIVCSPEVQDGPIILKAAARYGLKVLNMDDPIVDQSGKTDQPTMLGSDFKGAGKIAAAAMIKTAHEPTKNRKWDLKQAGMILFTHNSLQSAKSVTDAERSDMIKSGLSPEKIFEVPIENMSILNANLLATKILKKNPGVKNWFVGGMNDSVVVGGLRALESAQVNPSQVIGVGIEGDGAIYDLQRPVPSGMVASVLLPADKLGERAEHALSNWVTNDIKPFNDVLFQGILLDRKNVRQLKSEHHLFE